MAEEEEKKDTGKKNQTVIKRVKKYAAGHHGGSWKVAYADFMTAMMAFFLLMWLLGITSEEQKQGIADYFNGITVSKSGSGGTGGLMGGQSVMTQGGILADQQKTQQKTESESQKDESDIDKALAEREERYFRQVEEALKKSVEETPDLTALMDNLLIDETPEGLRIQIVDRDNESMFPLGGSQMYPTTHKLLGLVAQAVGKMPNKISVRGHTDSKPYDPTAAYNNWDLSTDRANASRRALLEGGLDEGRIANVMGRSDKEPLLTDKPEAPQNRRISIILLRQGKPPANLKTLGEVGVQNAG